MIFMAAHRHSCRCAAMLWEIEKMVFSSNVFLFAFLPGVLAAYFCLPRCFRNAVLLLWSLLFYGWGEPAYLLLMLGDILLNYLCGRWIGWARRRGKRGKAALIAGVTLNLLLLAFFKYAGFLSGGRIRGIVLPIGISFYIFQSMSYCIDVYRSDAPMQRNVLTFGTYVTLFPQLIAGPIVRYADVAQMLVSRRENLSQFSSGVRRFIIGLSKKVLLANPMGALWNLLREQPGTPAAFVGLLAYTMQIYFDFSGYSDMAIGLGRLFGFEFLENFNYPYISASITEFWRRWHISLSTWFREYVYIPLGGNRKGLPRQIGNIFIVWLLTGLWHGASWNFVLWGVYYAVLLILEKTFLLKCLRNAPGPVGHVYTAAAVMLGWSLFYFEDLTALGSFLGRLFSFAPSPEAGAVITAYLPTLLAALVMSTPLLKNLASRYREQAWAAWGKLPVYAALLLLCVASLASQSYNPFIYFRF